MDFLFTRYLSKARCAYLESVLLGAALSTASFCAASDEGLLNRAGESSYWERHFLRNLPPQEIIDAVSQIAKEDADEGLLQIYNVLSAWLSQNPFPSPEAPYSDWNAYAKTVQQQLAQDRSRAQNSASSQLTNDINDYIAKNQLDAGVVWNLVNAMNPSTATIIGDSFDAYSDLIQTSLINPIWSGKPGVLPKPSKPVPPDMQPATEKTLKINGVSYVLFIDPKAPTDASKAMGFPVSHTSDAGGSAVLSATSTEAIWYTLENAYNAQDKDLFQQTLNGYFYLAEQKAATVSDPKNSWAWTPGLAGWLINLGQPPGAVYQSGGFPYPQGDPGNPSLSTATDADEQIIALMLKAMTAFGDLDLHCFGGFPNSSAPSDSKMSSLIETATKTFLYNNISGHPQSSYDQAHHGFKYKSVLYNPVLCNDNWGGGGWVNDPGQADQGTFLNPSYFDPTTLVEIYNYVLSSQDPAISSQAAAFKQAVLNSVAYLTILQEQYQDPNNPNIAGMPDNPAWNENDGPSGNGPHPVGWDSIRFLTNVGKFIRSAQDPFGIFDSVKTMGQKMLNYVIAHSDQPYTPNMILENTPHGAQLKGPSLLGPLLVAMKALTPQDPNIPTVAESLKTALMIDMNKMDPADSSAYLYWQDQYYGVELGLVNTADSL